MTQTQYRGQIRQRRTPEEELERRQKAERLRAAGYWNAPTRGTCCLCVKRIERGQWIGKMPDRWSPDSTRRYGHWRCIDDLKAMIRARIDGGTTA
jgi:hypothetical protein